MKCPECLRPAGEDCDNPTLLLGVPLGMFHCGNCGVMQIAGLPHIRCERCKGTGEVEEAHDE